MCVKVLYLIVDFSFLGQNQKMPFLDGPSEKMNFSNFALLLLVHYIVALYKINAHNNVQYVLQFMFDLKLQNQLIVELMLN